MGLRRTDGRKARTTEDRERAREERERRRGNPAPSPASESVARGAQSVEVEAQPAEVQPAEAESVETGPAEAPPAEARPAVAELVEAQTTETELVETLPAETHLTEPEPIDTEPHGDTPLLPARVGVRRPELSRSYLHRPQLPRPRLEPPHLHRPQLSRPHLERPHLHRLHLSRPHLHRSRRGRSLAARLGTLAMLALAALVVGAGAYLVARALKHKSASPKPLATVRVLIPEGYTAAQIAQLARADGLKGDYSKAAASAARPTPGHYGAAASEHSPEGFLFPATYDMYAGAPVGELVAKQLTAFAENFGSEQRSRAKALGVSPYQLLIVASMVEREAVLERERPLVAAVIYNRLHRNIPLGIDATIRYALRDYTHPLTEAQLHSSSPYNTRTHSGLPPTPISNPGLASIEAAAKPAHVSYLYYVARADGCPGQVFSSSYAQFEHAAAAYQAALHANGGHVPSCRNGK